MPLLPKGKRSSVPESKQRHRVVVASQLPTSSILSALDKDLAERLVLSALSPDGPWKLPSDATALITDPSIVHRARELVAAPAGWPGQLRWVHLRSTGIDGVPSWLFEVPLVTTSRGAQAIAIAEYALAAMLDAAVQTPPQRVSSKIAWRGQTRDSLFGKTLGIVGYGAIGEAVAVRALAFGMKVMGVTRVPRPSTKNGVELASIETVLVASDILLVATPLTEATRKLLNKSAFGLMRRGVHLINVGRGEVVDSDALLEALNDGTVKRASLDVFDPEPPPDGHWVYKHEKVHLTAHSSSKAQVTDDQADSIAAYNLSCFIKGQVTEMQGVVNLERGY